MPMIGLFKMDPWKIFAERKLILVSVKDVQTGKDNIMPVRWCTRCSQEPALLAVSIAQTRYTYELLERNRYFGIAVPPASFDPAFIGSCSGRNTDKFTAGNLERFYGKYGVPFAKGSLLDIELEKCSSFRTGDHTFFVGQVLDAVVNI